ncbi:MAG: ATP-dependent 6-phosphofructokinase, partial [Nitrospinaceae bacterium]|nr:ATP-dependent 6-phosphofructokinase [Nitrospinaceae bacterium]NIR57016.1 ATP-dependent 6-phosphofructokinase [Nitrospinaceae bacterium]NIS87469.1 ATP-dependent 6-phosphofructokinase [Nitrospinaceae bacterium]NIU46512.1 ATP-dependent 6-phosphofructokinase [Nitrospinaceae bacterium]NIU98702.1 ATP-dependent 6-phosphofructokinase [Nitrospinaceae bacterium]
MKGTIGILTGGGDVPGLNPAIRAITLRALREGYRVLGIRKGWEGMIRIDRDRPAEDQDYCQELTGAVVNKVGRTGGTFLHTSRTQPSKVKKENVPPHLQSQYPEEINDLTPEVIRNLHYMGIDHLIPIGGDDTLSYAVRLHHEGFPVVAIPKTMDNDVSGTDYCIGFSTCVTRTIELTNQLRTSAGSHERFLVIEAFGRYAGFTSLLPTIAGASHRCLIPEHPFDIERLTELMSEDRRKNPSNYSIVIVSEGAQFAEGTMVFESEEADAYGHKKLGGIGDQVAARLKELSPKYNNGEQVGIINQRLGYLVRSGQPDALDTLVPVAFGNMAIQLMMEGRSGRLVSLRGGIYCHVDLAEVTATKKRVNIEKHYNTDRLRPDYKSFEGKPLFIMSCDDYSPEGERVDR